MFAVKADVLDVRRVAVVDTANGTRLIAETPSGRTVDLGSAGRSTRAAITVAQVHEGDIK